MKIFLLTAAAGVLLAGTTIAAEMDHSKMHEMMMKGGGPKADNRTVLNLPEPMKNMQKGMMRQHLNTVSEITAALAANDLPRAAKIAKDNLGWTPAEEERCSMVEKMTGEKDFLTLGKAVHTKADELSDAAAKGDRDKALADLSQLVKNCNACHERFRH